MTSDLSGYRGGHSQDGFAPQLRLHPLSWIFALSSSIRQMIVPLIVLLFFGARDEASAMAPLFFPLLLAVLLVRALWRQWVFRYGFGPRGLVVYDGLFFRNVRQIEYARIENVDTERGVLHRLFGVADVSVQTSTGGKAEVSISVLDLAAVQTMRDRVFAHGARPSDASSGAPAETVLLHLPIGELVRYGLIDNRGMIIIAAVLGALFEFGAFDIDRETALALLAASPFAWLVEIGPLLQVVFALIAVVSAVLAVRVLSVLLAIVTLYDFTLTRESADLRVRHGLFTRVALTLRTPRVQAVHQTQTLLHRWFNRASLIVDLTGDHGVAQEDGQRVQHRTRWLAPICLPAAAPELIANALPAIDLGAEPTWRPLAPGARRRVFRRGLMVSVLLTIPAVWYWGAPGAAVVLAGVPVAWLRAHLYVKYTAWALLPDALLFRHGWLTRRHTIAPRNRVQSTSLESSPFDRRWGMASVLVDTAGASAGRRIRIRYLDAASAQTLARALYRLARRRPQPSA